MHLWRNAFSWTRSPTVQSPDHAGAAYCILDSTVARNTSFRDCWGNPCDLSTRRAYNDRGLTVCSKSLTLAYSSKTYHRRSQGALGRQPPRIQDWQGIWHHKTHFWALSASTMHIFPGFCPGTHWGRLQHSPDSLGRGLAAHSPKTLPRLSAFRVEFRPFGPQECPQDKFLHTPIKLMTFWFWINHYHTVLLK